MLERQDYPPRTGKSRGHVLEGKMKEIEFEVGIGTREFFKVTTEEVSITANIN
jgi:hypothetical protein